MSFVVTVDGNPLIECLTLTDAMAIQASRPNAVIVDTETGMPVTATAAAEQEDVEPCLP